MVSPYTQPPTPSNNKLSTGTLKRQYGKKQYKKGRRKKRRYKNILHFLPLASHSIYILFPLASFILFHAPRFILLVFHILFSTSYFFIFYFLLTDPHHSLLPAPLSVPIGTERGAGKTSTPPQTTPQTIR